MLEVEDKLYEVKSKIDFFSAMFSAWNYGSLPFESSEGEAISLIFLEVANELELILRHISHKDHKGKLGS